MAANETQQTDLAHFDTAAPSLESFPAPDTADDLLAIAPEYAEHIVEEYDMDVPDDITWEISHRATRRAGVCIKERLTGHITIRLTWEACVINGWEDMKSTIRHELIHTEEHQLYGQAGHGPRFKHRARQMNVSQYCDTFNKGKFAVECAECGTLSGYKHRLCKTVRQPKPRYTTACDCATNAGLRIIHHETGLSWASNAEYKQLKHRL